MRTRLWVALALSMVFFGACVWSKPDTRTPVASAQQDSTEHSFFSAIAEGATDGVKNFVRNDLWKKKPEQKDRH